MGTTELDTKDKPSMSEEIASIVEEDEVPISLSALVKIITANISREGRVVIENTASPFQIIIDINDDMDVGNHGEILYDIERNLAYAITENWRDRIEMIRASVLSPINSREDFEDLENRAEELEEEILVNRDVDRPIDYDIVYPGHDFFGKKRKRRKG
jgi:hypothetical protein